MKRRVFASILAAALALNLAACGNNEQASNDGQQDSGAETIKIGWYGPLSGSAASVGTTGNMATKLAIKQINENGGILGKQIELMEYDDQGNTETSVKNVTRLIEQDQVVGIIGSHLSAAVLATSDVSEEAKVVQFLSLIHIWTAWPRDSERRSMI